jgi:hypothetical protein
MSTRDFYAEVAAMDPVSRQLLSTGLIPSNINNMLAVMAFASDVRMATIEAGGSRAREAAAIWAERAFFCGVSLGLRLRDVR